MYAKHPHDKIFHVLFVWYEVADMFILTVYYSIPKQNVKKSKSFWMCCGHPFFPPQPKFVICGNLSVAKPDKNYTVTMLNY